MIFVFVRCVCDRSKRKVHPDVPTSYGYSVYDYSTAPYSPSTSNQGSVDGIQTNRCHFGFPHPQLRSRNNIKKIVQNALAVIGVVCLFCHPIWSARDVKRCTSCASSKYLISNILLFHIFPNIHSLIAFISEQGQQNDLIKSVNHPSANVHQGSLIESTKSCVDPSLSGLSFVVDNSNSFTTAS